MWNFYTEFSEKIGPSCWIFWKNRTSTGKMWTFKRDFLKKVDFNLKVWIVTHHFRKKSGPLPEKCGPLRMIFWKKVYLDLKKVYLDPENVDNLGMIFWKMRTLMCDVLKKSGHQHENVDLYAWFSEKSGHRPEKCGPFWVIFRQQWTWTRKMRTLTRYFLNKWNSTIEMWNIRRNFLKIGALELRNVDL